MFVVGALLTGEPLEWALSPARRHEVRVKGRLWRTNSGDVLLELGESLSWVQGEMVAALPESRRHLLETLLGARERGLTWTEAWARSGCRAVRVVALAATEEALTRSGARPLRSGDSRDLSAAGFQRRLTGR